MNASAGALVAAQLLLGAGGPAAQEGGRPREALAPTVVEARLAAGGVQADLYSDLDALLLGMSPAAEASRRLVAMESLRRAGAQAQAAAQEALEDLLRRRVRLRFDGEAVPFEISFPDRRATPAGELLTLGPFVRLAAEAPAGARTFAFFASRSFRGVELRLVAAGGEPSKQVLQPGEASAPVPLP